MVGSAIIVKIMPGVLACLKELVLRVDKVPAAVLIVISDKDRTAAVFKGANNLPGVEGEEISKAVQDNMPASIDAVKAKAQELGLSDEQTTEIVGQMFQVMDDLVHGKIDTEVFAMMAKGKNFDEAVEQARDEGKVEGLNQKVNDKLRTLENRQERVAGVQTPMKTATPASKKPHNPFVFDENDEEY